MRPVDADVLIPLIQEDKIEGKILDIVKALGDGLQAETLNQACDRHIKMINGLPTIDAISVVRCKNCRHLEVVNKEPVYAVCEKNNHTFYLWQEDTHKFFCAYGERKDDEHTD